MVHFYHIVRSPREDAPRLNPAVLLLHGWPGSVAEFLDVFDRPELRGFDLVAPSLPGYAWSQAPSVPGFDTVCMAQVFDKLMGVLEYDRYFVQVMECSRCPHSRRVPTPSSVHLALPPSSLSADHLRVFAVLVLKESREKDAFHFPLSLPLFSCLGFP